METLRQSLKGSWLAHIRCDRQREMDLFGSYLCRFFFQICFRNMYYSMRFSCFLLDNASGWMHKRLKHKHSRNVKTRYLLIHFVTWQKLSMTLQCQSTDVHIYFDKNAQNTHYNKPASVFITLSTLTLRGTIFADTRRDASTYKRWIVRKKRSLSSLSLHYILNAQSRKYDCLMQLNS